MFECYPDDMSVPWFGPRMVCTKCGSLARMAGRIWSRGSQHVDAPPVLRGLVHDQCPLAKRLASVSFKRPVAWAPMLS